MRRGLSLVLIIVVLGTAALLRQFDADAPDVARSAASDRSAPAVAAAVQPKVQATAATLDSRAPARLPESPPEAGLDEQALQLLEPYLRECGISTFAVQSGDGTNMSEFMGLTRTVNRLGVSPTESLERVDWKGSVNLGWQDERKRCIDCEQQWQDWTGAGSVLMEARRTNGVWKAKAPNSAFVQLQPSWTCEWFQRIPASPATEFAQGTAN